MKFENPPQTEFDIKIMSDYAKKEYQEFLQKTDDKYYYWNELKYRKDLPYNDALKAWTLTKIHRRINYKNIQFAQKTFHYFLTQNIQKSLHEFDLKLVGGLYENPITRNEQAEYLKNSILEEAIASSQMEGASTTTKVAYEMLKSKRKPRNESEQMIFNNLKCIQYITEEGQKPLDFQFIIEIHQIMTAKTSAENCAGEFRKEQVFVQDIIEGEIAHTPPEFAEIEAYMSDFCKFANTDEPFIHPIVKASILHFMFGYIHPFMDGNGRTARALFYWFLVKKGYTFIKNVSISRAILDSRIQYDKAFLKTENDENDLTYFINYSIKSLRVAFERLVRFRDKKKAQRENSNLLAYQLISRNLSKRQADLVSFLYFRKEAEISIKSYAERHQIVRQTARKDLNELVKFNLLVEEKNGRNVFFKLSSKENVTQFLEQN